ncbi:MAG: ABC transporter substrate-binding protein [Chloroflexi bacterium]|nr:ABC transporter substrate-binding protein [Chloroflexota bacterium]
MTHRFPITRLRLAPLLVAFALLAATALVACTGDDGDEAASMATAAPATATATATLAAATPAPAAAAATPTPAPATATPSPTPSPTPTESPAFPVTIEDSDGVEVTLEAAPQRIISYSPGATEILFAVGAGDRVVAADEFSDYPPETADLPRLTYSSPDPERALTLNPDLVIMASRQREQIEQFRGLGMTVLFINEAESLEGVMETVVQLGAITGNQQQAAELVASMRARIDALTTALEGVEEGPRVFFELTADLYTVGPDTFVGNLLTLAKAQNVATGASSPFPQLTAEAIIAADPEVVLLADGAWGESLETVCARPGWDAISACVNERVHPVDGDLTSRPGPRVVEGLEEIARLLYPDLFP